MHADTVLRESIVKSTKILAGKNIKVFMEGFQPRVAFDPVTKKPVEIVLPVLPDGCPKDLVDAIKGYQDHECYHVLYSSYDDITDTSKSSGWHFMHNVVDDNYINASGAKDFPGTHIELINAYKYVFDNMETYKDAHIHKIFAENKKGALAGYITSWVAKKMNSEFVSRWYDESPLPTYYKELDDKLPADLKAKLENCSSPDDVRNLTDELMIFLKDISEEIEKIAKASEKSQDFKKGEKGEKGGKGEKGEKGQKGKGDSGEGKEEDSSKDKSEGGEGDGDGSSGDEDDYDEHSMPINVEDYPSSFEDSLKATIGKNIALKFKDQKGTFFWSDRMNEIITTDDYGGRTRGHYDLKSTVGLDRFDGECKAVSNYLRKRLERLLESRNRVYYVGGHKSGKLTGKNLFSVPLGNTHVFSKKNDVRALNASVGLLLDLSGSMSGEKVHLASKCTYTMADCLDRLKIPFEALGFWTDAGVTIDTGEVYKEWDKFTRTVDGRLIEKVVNPYSVNTTFVFKSFDEPFGVRQKSSLLAASKGVIGMQQNEDATHLRIALERVSKQPSEKKVLFVFSDGSPYFNSSPANSRAKLKELAKAAYRDYGVTVVGIGIMCDNVIEFYDNAKVVNNLEELPSTVFEVLTNQLLNRN